MYPRRRNIIKNTIKQRVLNQIGLGASVGLRGSRPIRISSSDINVVCFVVVVDSKISFRFSFIFDPTGKRCSPLARFELKSNCPFILEFPLALI